MRAKGQGRIPISKTGGEKSLCYQTFVPFWLQQNSDAKIISPLISTMKEQCSYIQSCGFSATFIGKDSDENEDIMDGKFQFLFSSPESVLSINKWRDMLKVSDRFRLLVVDEAHTVLHW